MSNGALLRDPVIKQIAEAHGKTPAQVILRWHIQEGFSVIPGASNPVNKEKRFFNATLEDVEKMVWGARL